MAILFISMHYWGKLSNQGKNRVLMIIFAVIGITKIETTGNLVDDIPKNDPISVDLKFFEDNFVGVMPFEIMINTNKNNGITKSSTLKRIQKLVS